MNSRSEFDLRQNAKAFRQSVQFDDSKHNIYTYILIDSINKLQFHCDIMANVIFIILNKQKSILIAACYKAKTHKPLPEKKPDKF